MRSLPEAVATHLATGAGMNVHVLIWLTARDRTTGEHETFGIWTGADHQVITVEGVDRTFYGVGALLDVDPFTSSAAGTNQSWSFRVSPLHAQIVDAIRTYESRLAPVEVHEWHHNPLTNTALAPPIRAFRGTVAQVSIPTPAEGPDGAPAETDATIQCVTDAWRLTRGLTLRRSQSALKSREPLDTFRDNNSLVGIETAWGEKSAVAAGETVPPTTWGNGGEIMR